MTGRLSSLLRIRRVQERQKLGELARTEAALAAAEREADEARQARERFSWALPAGVPLDAAGLRRVQLEALAYHDAEVAALADVAARRHRRDHAHDGWSASRVALRSVERLAEHRAAIQAADAAARAQANADELALLMRRRP